MAEISHSNVNNPAPDYTLVIFGASGDLTQRKLIPAVFSLFRQNLLPPGFRLIGYARSEMTDQQFRTRLTESLTEHCPDCSSENPAWKKFIDCISYCPGQYDSPDNFAQLAQRIHSSGSANVLFYLSTPPSVFVPIIQGLADSGLSKPPQNGFARIIIEKPFGRDLASAQELNQHIRRAFREEQIFRIDHYLGKETVQNLLVFRFANSIFEPIWNNKYIDHVQITVAETVDVAGRGSYYDQSGALRDMLQNHMMHLLCLVAMEPPHSLKADAIRDEKVQVLRSLQPLTPESVDSSLIRAQYSAGKVKGHHVPGYLELEDVPNDSKTETFAAIKMFIDNWRWSEVPFYLRTGKTLPARVTEIGIHFKSVPHVLFNLPDAPASPLPPNVLTLRIQPNEGMSLRFQVKVPGAADDIQPLTMNFGYADAFGDKPPEAYERLILEAAEGDATLFTRSDEVETAWEFFAPVLQCCNQNNSKPLPSYPAGSWGPAAGDELIERDGREWYLTRRPVSPKAVESL